MNHTFVFFILITLFAPDTWASAPQGFYFFGDSLSDSGYQNNNPLVKRLGKTPQWTSPHGHTWVYYFLQNHAQHNPKMNTHLQANNVDAAALYNPIPTHILPILDGNNFAAGGSTTGGAGIINTKDYKSPSLLQQVDYFVDQYAPQHHVSLANNQYLIWSGSNDLIKKLAFDLWIAGLLEKLHLARLAAALHLFDVHHLEARFTKTQATIATNLLAAVSNLKHAGAKKIIVILLPDIGVTPLIDDFAQGLQKNGHSTLTSAELAMEMRDVTDETNALIQKKLAGTQVIIIDVNRLMRPLTAIQAPEQFQETITEFGQQRPFLVVNNTTGACAPKQQALTCIPTVNNAQHYVFEDAVHPTDQTHQIIGDYVYYQSLAIARNPSSTGIVSGNTPCQIKNASAACSTNIPNPSTAKHP